jgi:formylglycine-generating enzyme required for sulfatase activity
MVRIPGGAFRTGSNDHYPEAPVHRVTMDGLCIDRTPVTNRQFKVMRQAEKPDAAGQYVTGHRRTLHALSP